MRGAFPECDRAFAERGWKLFPSIDRVYVNQKAREALDWMPRFDFGFALSRLQEEKDPQSTLARTIGAKGYHPYTTLPYTER